jgi:hypothetical protein
LALELDLERFREARAQALEVVRSLAGAEADAGRLFEATATLAGKSRRAESPEENGRAGFEFSLDILYSLLTDILYSLSGAPESGFRHPDLRSDLERLAPRLSVRRVEQAVRELDRIHGSLRRNINRQLALDALALGSAPAS